MQESHNIIPATMRARNSETGQWEVLHLDDLALDWLGIPWECYVDDGPDGGEQVDFDDYDSFEAVL